MRLSLRFIIPLMLALAAIAYSVVPLVDQLTLRWFVRDLDIRAELVANSLQEPLQEQLLVGKPAKIQAYLGRLIQDERLFGLGGHFIDRWREIADRFYLENRSLVRRRYLMAFALGSLTTIVTSGTFLYVALQAVRRRLTLGDLTFYSQAVGQVR